MGASGRVPRTILGGVATGLLDNGDAARALALVAPAVRAAGAAGRAGRGVAQHAAGGLSRRSTSTTERWEEAERLARELRPPLRAVLWENLARAYAVEGEMEEAWTSLDRAREDDPESPALGPLEVSLLLAEGRTAEAGERARYWRGRLREGDLTEQGFEFLARVGENAEETQLRFSFGDEVTERIHQLEAWLARAGAAGGRLRDRGRRRTIRRPAGWSLRAPLRELEAASRRCSIRPRPIRRPREEDEDWDPWDEDRAERWLGYLLEHPAALDSVDILEDVAHAVSEIAADRYAFLDRPLLRPLLDRGLAVVRQALAAHPGITRLPSELEPNGSALALVVAAAAQAHRLGETDRARELLDWLRDAGAAQPGERRRERRRTGGLPPADAVSASSPRLRCSDMVGMEMIMSYNRGHADLSGRDSSSPIRNSRISSTDYLERIAGTERRGEAREESFYASPARPLRAVRGAPGVARPPGDLIAAAEDPWTACSTSRCGGGSGSPATSRRSGRGRTWTGTAESAQLERYRAAFPNLLLTNFRELPALPGEGAGGPRRDRPLAGGPEPLLALLDLFCDFAPPASASASELAPRMALRTRLLAARHRASC